MNRRWLFGTLLSIGGLFALLLLLVVVHLKRNQDIDPPDFSDLVPQRQPVPEEENAYLLLLEASKQYVEDEQDLITKFWDGESFDEQALLVLFEANQAAISNIHEAVKRKGYWHEQEYSYDALVPEITGWMELGKLMQVQSEWMRRERQLEDAIALTVDLNQFGVTVGGDGATLITHLVGMALAELGAEQSRRMVRDVNCPPELLQPLEISLRGGDRLYVGAAESLRAEFTTMRNTFAMLAEAPEAYTDLGGESGGLTLKTMTSIPLVWGYMLHPNRSMEIVAEEFRPVIAGLQTPWSADLNQDPDEMPAALDIPESSREMAKPNRVGILLLSITLPVISGSVNRVLQIQASREATRILIGLRLYELSEGRLPERLDELVPGYLERIPVDPFSGQPFRYDREREIVWSVGKDRVDQGGSVREPDGEVPKDETRAEDQVYSLRKSFEELLNESAEP